MTERAHEQITDDNDAPLLAIESIKQLKARYCRYLDTKDWAAWRAIFTNDFLSDTSEAGGKLIIGADDFVACTRKAIGRPAQATAHQVHAPEIELTSEATARGVWALIAKNTAPRRWLRPIEALKPIEARRSSRQQSRRRRTPGVPGDRPPLEQTVDVASAGDVERE
jgi:hypothetical protein